MKLFKKILGVAAKVTNLKKSAPSLEQLKILQIVTQQVVLSVEGSVKLPGSDKKAVALELAAQILQEMGIVAPNSLVDTMIESSVQVLKAANRES